MRIRGALVGAALVLIALSASGCSTPSDPIVTTASPTFTPVFASDEEALKAAEAAYAAYLSMSNEIAADGGDRADRIRDLVTLEEYQRELEGFETYRTKQIRAVGVSRAGKALLQKNVVDGGSTEISFYVCVDNSGLRVISADGTDVTPESRADMQTVEVQILSEKSAPARLLVDRVSQWSGDSVC